MSRSGDVWDNSVIFLTMKTERCNRKSYGIRDAARADVFGYPRRRHSTIRHTYKSGTVSTGHRINLDG